MTAEYENFLKRISVRINGYNITIVITLKDVNKRAKSSALGVVTADFNKAGSKK